MPPAAGAIPSSAILDRMPSVVGVRLGLTPDVLRAAIHDPDLRRLQLAWMAVNAGRWAFLITNLVFAYDNGGPAAAGLLGLATFAAPTFIAPLSGLPAARWRPDRVLLAVTAIRTLAVALTVGLVAFDGPLTVLLVLVSLEAGAGAFGRPLHMTILPLIARSPAELVAAGAASSAAEGIGVFVGPAVAGLLLGATGLLGAHLSVLVVYALAVASIARLEVPGGQPRSRARAPVRAQLIAGARAFAAVPARRQIIAGVAAQTMVRGALTVLTVIAAIELLGMGRPGAGLLNAAFGAGGFLGAVASVALAGRKRLAPAVAVSLAAWGAPIALIGLFGDPLVALAGMVVIGTANAVLDVAAFTLLLRTTPHEVRVPVLGLLDSVVNGTQAIGGLVAPALVALLGIEGALIVTGTVLPVVALATWPAVRHADDHAVVDTDRLSRIRTDPLFAPLSMAIVEELAGQLRPVRFDAGAWIMHEGQAGDLYYLIERGRVEVSQDGVALRRCGPGEGVGEIALLRDVPRTASVRALTAVDAHTLERDDFLQAVTGSPGSRQAADSLITARRPDLTGAP